MVNDPRALTGSRLKNALLQLGRDNGLRAELMEWLKHSEGRLTYGGSVRDDIIGPIIDALHSEEDVYEKRLSDGTRFRFLYRTKIARDFLLAQQEHPSHVWEPQTTRLLQYLTAKTHGDVLIGGAYFGDHAVLLGVQLKGSGRLVHCFEPNTDQAAMLAVNGHLNGLDNLRINDLGLWHESSQRLELTGFDSFANAVQATGDEGFETVTIDDYCRAQKCNIGVLMLDIEGSELPALQGATRVMEQDKPAVVFEIHRDYVDWSDGLMKTPICTLLENVGYQLYAVRDFNTHQEMGDLPIELIPVDSIYLEGPPHGFNMLAVADPVLVRDSCFKQVQNVSPKLLRHKSPALHHPLGGMPD